MASYNTANQRDVPLLRDIAAKLEGKAILPAAGATTYSTRGVDLSEFWSKSKDAMVADVELVIQVGNLTVANMVNADTLKISVLLDVNSTIDGSSIVYMLDVLDFLGAGGIGDLGEEVRIKIPSVGFKVNIAGVTTKYDFVGVRCIHTGTGVPATATGGLVLPDNDGFCHCHPVF